MRLIIRTSEPWSLIKLTRLLLNSPLNDNAAIKPDERLIAIHIQTQHVDCVETILGFANYINESTIMELKSNLEIDLVNNGTLIGAIQLERDTTTTPEISATEPAHAA